MNNLTLKLFVALLSILGSHIYADEAYLTIKGNNKSKLDSHQTDYVRENLIHIFDSSLFHCLEGGWHRVKTEKEIENKIEKIRSQSFIELELDEPARIVVEGTALKVKTMWVKIRESDGFVGTLVFQQPNGDLVSLEKAQGLLVVQFAPYALQLLKPNSEPVDSEQ
jgi:hypothetical protein